MTQIEFCKTCGREKENDKVCIVVHYLCADCGRDFDTFEEANECECEDE